MNDRTPSRSGRRRGTHGRSRRSKVSTREHTAVSREERKLKTRQDLLQAALRLLENKSFGSLSLREVTREAGVVPTAFYRHFEDMDELGLALVEDSFRTLRQGLREVRTGLPPKGMIRRSLEVLVNHVNENRLHFRFIVRERYAGVSALRHAIRSELRLLVSELATDLARLPYLEEWTTDDLQMMAGLMVNAVVSTAEAIVDSPGSSPEREQEVINATEHQLRLIALGVPHWKSGAGGGSSDD